MIRRFRDDDAAAVSEIIVDNLRTVNIHDYSEELIEELAIHNTPQSVLKSANRYDAFVAVENGNVLGVIMLSRYKIRNLFVHTQMHSRGIGRSLVSHIESLARRRQFSRLNVDSSITAVEFYEKCGYIPVRRLNKPFSGIRNVVTEMVKILG